MLEVGARQDVEVEVEVVVKVVALHSLVVINLYPVNSVNHDFNCKVE